MIISPAKLFESDISSFSLISTAQEVTLSSIYQEKFLSLSVLPGFTVIPRVASSVSFHCSSRGAKSMRFSVAKAGKANVNNSNAARNRLTRVFVFFIFLFSFTD